VLSYRVMLDVPAQLVAFMSGLLAERRREIGTRNGIRALSCWKQAVFALAWFRDRPDVRRLGTGFGISQATAYRYLDEAIEVLAARAPSMRQALELARRLDLTYLILDGMIIAADRCREDHQQEERGDRPVVLRQGASSGRQHPGAVRAPRRPAVGQRRAARQHPRHHRSPRAGPARAAALPEGNSRSWPIPGSKAPGPACTSR
jgi:hypothetical protein